MIWHVLAWVIEGIGMTAVASVVLIWLDHRVQRHKETREVIKQAARIHMRRHRNARLDHMWGRYGVAFEADYARQDETEGGEDW